MHWCIDETLAVLRFLMLIPLFGWWARSHYYAWKHRHDEKEHECHDDHDDETGDT